MPYDDNVVAKTETGNVAGNVAGKYAGNVMKILFAIGNDILAVKDIMERLNLKGADNFRKLYLYPALEYGYILRTEPDNLKSPNQKYYLSEKGKDFIKDNF